MKKAASTKDALGSAGPAPFTAKQQHLLRQLRIIRVKALKLKVEAERLWSRKLATYEELFDLEHGTVSRRAPRKK
jgi:hypothetical protein